MSKKNVYCQKCSGLIIAREDLVVSITLFLAVVPYHESCFSNHLKGVQSFFISNAPINGVASNIVMVIVTIAVLFAFILGEIWIALLTIPLFVIRLYSYIAYERHLPRW